MKARIKFKKFASMKFIGHLDIMRYFQKAMRRAEISVTLSKGYSPHMIMSFANPLGVGITSDGEYFDVELEERISSKECVRRLNDVMVEGIEIISMVELGGEAKTGMSIVVAADYQSFWKPEEVFEGWENKVKSFLEEPHILIVKKTKKSEKEVDIRPLIYKFEAREKKIYMQVATGSVENLKPELVMSAFCNYVGMKETVTFIHHRLEVYADVGGLVPLEYLGKEVV